MAAAAEGPAEQFAGNVLRIMSSPSYANGILNYTINRGVQGPALEQLQQKVIQLIKNQAESLTGIVKGVFDERELAMLNSPEFSSLMESLYLRGNEIFERVFYKEQDRLRQDPAYQGPLRNEPRGPKPRSAHPLLNVDNHHFAIVTIQSLSRNMITKEGLSELETAADELHQSLEEGSRVFLDRAVNVMDSKEREICLKLWTIFSRRVQGDIIKIQEEIFAARPQIYAEALFTSPPQALFSWEAGCPAPRVDQLLRQHALQELPKYVPKQMAIPIEEALAQLNIDEVRACLAIHLMRLPYTGLVKYLGAHPDSAMRYFFPAEAISPMK